SSLEASLAGPRSRLQLAFKLVEKAPIGAVDDEFVGSGFELSELVHPQTVEAQRVFRVELAPAVPWDLVQGLERAGVGKLDEAAVVHLPYGTLRLRPAQIGRLQDGAQHALGGNRIPLDKVRVAGQQAAEILRPRLIQRHIQDRATD